MPDRLYLGERCDGVGALGRPVVHPGDSALRGGPPPASPRRRPPPPARPTSPRPRRRRRSRSHPDGRPDTAPSPTGGQVRMFTTPPGRSAVAMASASTTDGAGPTLRSQHHRRVPRHDHRRQPGHQTQQGRRLRCDHPHHSGRLRHRDVEEKARPPGSGSLSPAGTCRPTRHTRPDGRSTGTLPGGPWRRRPRPSEPGRRKQPPCPPPSRRSCR